MSVPDIDIFKKIYPGWFNEPNLTDILVLLFFFSLPVLIPYLYIRFFESKAVSFIRNSLIPFIMHRLHLKRLIALINRILRFRIFGNLRAKI
ncbi:MAG: hypothetical protein OIN66_03880 [Candidatus Methanoperedens sp.]|nr:hypothetical protein [Candidatus Methanoperedens sp.]